MSDPARSAGLTALLAMARPSQVGLIVLVYAAGVLLALWRDGSAPVATVMVGLALLIAAAVAVHWANEAADVETDALAVRTRFSGGSGALLRSGYDRALLHRQSLLLAASVAAMTILLVAAAGFPPAAAVLLLLGTAGGMAYSVPPVALMRRGVGEPVNALLGGLMLPLFGVAAARGHVGSLDVLAFLPFALITFCSVMATAWPDRTADGATGKRTLQVRLDASRLRIVYSLSATAWSSLVLVAAVLGAAPLPLLWLGVLPFVVLGWTWYTRRLSPWPSVAAMVGHILLMAVTTMMALLAL